MDEKRQGEIALALWKYHLRRSGVMISKHKLRDLGNAAKDIGIPFEELKEFAQIQISEFIQELLIAKKQKQGEVKAS